MAHGDVALAQPFGSAARIRHPAIVNPHQPAAVCRVDRQCDGLDPIQAGRGGAICDQDDLIRLPNCRSRPVGKFLIRQIDDQLVFAFDRIQPIENGRVVQPQIRKPRFEVGVAEKKTSSRTCKSAAQTIKERGRNAAMPRRDDRDRARRRDAGAAGDAGGGFGKPSRHGPQQLVVDGGHATRDVLERGAVEFEHDRVAHRNDGRRAQSAGEKSDLTDRLADSDFGQRHRHSFEPNLESAGHHNEYRIGRRVLPDQRFASEQTANSGARPDLGLLIGRQFAEGGRSGCHLRQHRVQRRHDFRLVSTPIMHAQSEPPIGG